MHALPSLLFGDESFSHDPFSSHQHASIREIRGCHKELSKERALNEEQW
jgi:hypothetical protein